MLSLTQETLSRRIARARVLGAAAILTEAEQTADMREERRLVGEAIRHCLSAAAVLEFARQPRESEEEPAA